MAAFNVFEKPSCDSKAEGLEQVEVNDSYTMVVVDQEGAQIELATQHDLHGHSFSWCGTKKASFCNDWHGKPLAQVGISGHIPLWYNEVRVHFGIESSFPDQTSRNLTWSAFDRAAKSWNLEMIKAAPQGPRITGSRTREEINCVLSYERSMGTIVAQAFLPSNNEHNRLIVTQAFLDIKSEAERVHIMEHELGHVLGFRHEFAIDNEGEAVVLNGRDPQSIMSYDRQHWHITPKDKEALKILYGTIFSGANGQPAWRYQPHRYKGR